MTELAMNSLIHFSKFLYTDALRIPPNPHPTQCVTVVIITLAPISDDGSPGNFLINIPYFGFNYTNQVKLLFKNHFPNLHLFRGGVKTPNIPAR